MDDIKDTSKQGQLSRFLDNHPVRTNPFGRNSSGEKAYRRAERLVAALHLLTCHVPGEEPARQSVRKAGLKLLLDVLALRDEMRVQNSAKVRVVQSSVRELISLVRMLAVSGFISFQNADVVTEALDELGNFLNASQRSTLAESVVFEREDLLATPAFHSAHRTFTSSRAAVVLPPVPGTETKIPAQLLKDRVSIKDNRTSKGNKAFRAVDNRTEEVNARARAIMDVLRSNGELGIRDVSSNLPEYSVKMIQRELASLVAAGLVKKTGLKRWSRYSLA